MVMITSTAKEVVMISAAKDGNDYVYCYRW